MTAAFGGVLETLELQRGGRRLPVVTAVRDRVRVVSFDGPGFGDSDRPALGEDAALRRTSLEGVLTDLDARQQGPAPLHPGDGVSGPDPRR